MQCIDEGVVKTTAQMEGEGCSVYGYILVNKVAGNFHIAPGTSYQDSYTHVHEIELSKCVLCFSYPFSSPDHLIIPILLRHFPLERNFRVWSILLMEFIKLMVPYFALYVLNEL